MKQLTLNRNDDKSCLDHEILYDFQEKIEIYEELHVLVQILEHSNTLREIHGELLGSGELGPLFDEFLKDNGYYYNPFNFTAYESRILAEDLKDIPMDTRDHLMQFVNQSRSASWVDSAMMIMALDLGFESSDLSYYSEINKIIYGEGTE